MPRREAKRASGLSRSIDRHFLACAAAATAFVTAGSTESADAQVQYSGLLDIGVNHTTSAGVYIDFDTLMVTTSGGTNPGWDANIFNVNATTSTLKSVLLYVPAGTPNMAVGNNLPTYAYITRLGAGVSVGAASNFPTLPPGYPYGIFAYRSGMGTYDQSQWNGGVTDGFAGYRFRGADNELHYGWIRLNIEPFTSGTPYRITLRDFGWESQPNTPILTGAGIPEPAGLALGVLALGALGIRPRRNK